jgi:membrane protein CcdC involved in cytochrome C biogenesis
MSDPLSLPLTSGVVGLLGAAGVLIWRIRESQRPVTMKSLVIPPLGMSTGFSMFVVPAFRVPWTWGFGAFVLGAGVFAWPLIATSRLTVDGDQVLMRRSRWFLLILVALVALRFALREYVGEVLPPEATAGLFFVLAFGMIVRWRASLVLQYRRLAATVAPGA